MKTRLILAALVVAIAAIAIAVLRVVNPPPPVTPIVAESMSAVAPAPAVSMAASESPVAAPSPVETASAASAPAGETASPAATVQPTATPTATPTPNLLTAHSGAFVRRWTPGGFENSPQLLPQEQGSIALSPSFARPIEVLYELPSVAHLERVGVMLRGAGRQAAHVDISVGTDLRGLRRVGTAPVSLPADSDVERFVDIGSDARFVQITIARAVNTKVSVVRVSAAGTAGPPQRGSLSGTWVSGEGAGDLPFGNVRGAIPDRLPAGARFDPRIAIQDDDRLSLFECQYRNDAWQGVVRDNVADSSVATSTPERVQLAGDGNVLVGYAAGRFVLALRAKSAAVCTSTVAGRGRPVLALVRVLGEDAPELDPAVFPGYRIEQQLAPLFSAVQLQRANFAVLDSDCNAFSDISARRQQMLMQWVAAGHKLIVRDSDLCSKSDYSFVPFRFTTNATGAMGARGKVLAIADPSTLGSGPSDPDHVLDVAAYLASQAQQIGDADVMKTDDPHWCGHLFTTNALNANGWVHAYARYGRGLIIYDGFDRDDLKAKVPAAMRLTQLEYAQPAQAELPCNARVASALVLYPSTDKALPAGRPVVIRVPMHVALSTKQTAAKDISLSIAGDPRYRASLSPSRVTLGGGNGLPLEATVSLPSGWSGSHAYTVAATGEFGLSAQATIRIDGSVALAKAFESQRRIRIYGIHFDVASARIQPASETTIAQIAQVLDVHRDWKMRVEGHTDSDGGAAYNQGLSVKRAESVVDDLVTRYHIARARLTSAGFGLTKPVASNGTEAGKALNRRVELVRS